MSVEFKEVFTRNIGWKIGGLVLALALWFHLATEKIYERSFPVNIEFVGLSKDLDVAGISPPGATITITGTGKQLLKLSVTGRLSLIADLSYIRNPGPASIRLTIANLARIDPSQFRKITLEGNGVFNLDIKEKT